ncbi:murein hydrolase activator EnvC family protein [Halobacillus seohaensis]|uniref:Murein hydrolase activator EnvC family protein n=1 Tax=Halobacillus seohaensis TaxID=447421 RepID=A0ABW2EIW0_9BACI
MKAKLIVSVLFVFFLASGLLTSQISAESNEEKLNDVKKQQEEKASEKQEKLNEINKIQQKQETVDDKIKKIEQEIEETSSNIQVKEDEISQTTSDIEKLKEEITVIEERIAERDSLLKERVKSMHQNGGSIDYLDVLMGAQNFGDLLERVMSLNTIAEQDQEILTEHQNDKKEVDQKKQEVEEQLQALEQKKEELESLQSELNNKKSEQDEYMSLLEKEEKELHNHTMELEEEQETLRAQEVAIKEEIERQKELERQKERERQEELARKRKSNQEQSNSQVNQTSQSDSSGSTSTGQANASGSTFNWPSAGVLTSGIGQRGGSFHAGIDIAKAGTVPIRAAADGTVIRAYKSSSYGNVVYISHYINGQTYTTLYAHMRSTPSVSTGQSVSAGTFLGNMGNTGRSRGQHLHFELHKGSWNGSKSNAVNPLQYLP